MNIFKALSEGNGRISETNITSFLNYLLDSSNELNNSLVLLFLKLIDKELDGSGILASFGIEDLDLRTSLFYFNQRFTVTAEPEYSVLGDDGKRQIPDIVMTLKDSELEDVLYLIIENKIKRSAKSDFQIVKQYEYISSSDDFSRDVPIYNVLITPDETAFKEMYLNGKNVNKNTVWLKWYSIESNNSIVGIIQKLIEFEHLAKIHPIDLNSLYILKSFVDYLSSEFVQKINGKKNFDIKGFSVIDEYLYKGNVGAFFIRRYSNQMIRLFDENDEILNVEVKPILRDVIKSENLDINLLHANGKPKNTQILGRELIAFYEKDEIKRKLEV